MPRERKSGPFTGLFSEIWSQDFSNPCKFYFCLVLDRPWSDFDVLCFFESCECNVFIRIITFGFCWVLWNAIEFEIHYQTPMRHIGKDGEICFGWNAVNFNQRYFQSSQGEFHKVYPETNESGAGLSNARFDIRCGYHTKKLQVLKDKNKPCTDWRNPGSKFSAQKSGKWADFLSRGIFLFLNGFSWKLENLSVSWSSFGFYFWFFNAIVR